MIVFIGYFMKPTKNFRLSKRNKTLAALLQHAKPEMRHTFKAIMIQATLEGATRGVADRK
jgi:hypothetical protein